MIVSAAALMGKQTVSNDNHDFSLVFRLREYDRICGVQHCWLHLPPTDYLNVSLVL